jgi:hypothetical protein
MEKGKVIFKMEQKQTIPKLNVILISTLLLSHVLLTKDGVRIGNWIYYPPTVRNYK